MITYPYICSFCSQCIKFNSSTCYNSIHNIQFFIHFHYCCITCFQRIHLLKESKIQFLPIYFTQVRIVISFKLFPEYGFSPKELRKIEGTIFHHKFNILNSFKQKMYNIIYKRLVIEKEQKMTKKKAAPIISVVRQCSKQIKEIKQ